MSNFIDDFLDSTGAPQDLRDAINRVRAERERYENLTDEERSEIIRNSFDRALFAFRGADRDAHIARTILGSFLEVIETLEQEARYMEEDKTHQPRISSDAVLVATDYVKAADKFLAAFGPLTSTRAVALDLRIPPLYVPPSKRERDNPDPAEDDAVHSTSVAGGGI